MSVVSTITEDPANALVVVPPDTQGRDSVPDESCSVEQLKKYALERLTEANILARRSTVQIYRAGWAMSLLRKKEKSNREWVSWQYENNLPRTSVWEAIQLYKKAPSEEAIANLTITEAKERYKITKKRNSPAGRPSRGKKGPGGGTTQPSQGSSRTTTAPPEGGPDLDAVARNLGEEYRQAILSGEAQLSPDEIKILAGGESSESRPRTPVVVVVPPQSARQDQPAPVGLLEHRPLAGVEAAGEEEPVDEALLGQANDLVHKMNQTTRLAFVSQPLVLTAVRRLPRDLTTAA